MKYKLFFACMIVALLGGSVHAASSSGNYNVMVENDHVYGKMIP